MESSQDQSRPNPFKRLLERFNRSKTPSIDIQSRENQRFLDEKNILNRERRKKIDYLPNHSPNPTPQIYKDVSNT